MWESWKNRKNRDEMEEMPRAAQEFAAEQTEEEVQQMLEDFLAEDTSGAGKKQTEKKKQRFGRLRGLGKRVTGWSRRRKVLVGGGLLLFLFLSTKACGGGGETFPMVDAKPLTKGAVKEVLSLSGPVSGTESADVVSNLHAEVLEIKVREGDRVTRGQLLAVLDRSDVQKEVEIARNAYDLAVSEYEENKRDTQHRYEKACQDLQTAQLAYERNKVLFEAGDISSMEMEGYANAVKDAARQVDSFTVSQGRAVPDQSYELKVKSAQYELEQKQTDLENTEVKSPIDGTVTRVNSRVGQFADKPEDEKPMFMVENLERLEMEIAVSEYSIGKVRVGQKAVITADILNGKTAAGEVISISPTGEEKGGGSSERVVPTTIRIEDGSEAGLIAGITARASVTTGEAEDVFKVLQTSLTLMEDGSTAVAVVEESSGVVRLVPVTVGVESDLEAEITAAGDDSLTEGLLILTDPSGITEGMKVTVNQGGAL